MIDLINSQIVWTVAIAWVIAHTIKFFTKTYKEKDAELNNFFSPGGFPSGHTTLVVAMFLSIAFQEGWGDPLTAVAAIFAFIVMYDATSIRYQAGLHAELLNEISNPVTIIGRRLKEDLGHRYVEVFGGFVVGTAVAVISYYII